MSMHLRVLTMLERIALRGTVLLMAVLLAGCAAAEEAQVPPDEQYGHRYEAQGPDGRYVFTPTDPDPDEDYFTYDAPISEIIMRRAAAEDVEDAAPGAQHIDLLIKGALPNRCMELHEVSQQRSSRMIDVTLTVRKERGSTCPAMRYPFRIYVELDGPLEPGSYTLNVNDTMKPFEIREPS